VRRKSRAESCRCHVDDVAFVERWNQLQRIVKSRAGPPPNIVPGALQPIVGSKMPLTVYFPQLHHAGVYNSNERKKKMHSNLLVY
jgi:hypothetical protein